MEKLNYKPYTIKSLRRIKELKKLPKERLEDIKIVASILPFKTNNYVINKLINWKNVPNDPIYILNFPQKEMLHPNHFELMKKALNSENDDLIDFIINKIRTELNPHPAGQKNYNIPIFHGSMLRGIQHKYRETALFFPKQGQNCHAFCTFCFRWPQFLKFSEHKFAMEEIDTVVEYISENSYITDLLITGGDPMVMKAKIMKKYIDPLLESNLPNLRSIRIGTKSLSYWPYRYISDPDSKDLLEIFSNIKEHGINLAIMAHFNHYQELQTEELRIAIKNIRKTGAQIRTQSPILRHINDKSLIWVRLLKMQTQLGMVPYYMFIPRDTGTYHYYTLPLSEAWKIFKSTYSKVSGLSRTIRGPSMSCTPGKIEISGITRINNEKVFVLKFIQARNPEWVGKPFFAKYNSQASWICDLKPLTGEKFFYETEIDDYLKPYNEIIEDHHSEETMQLKKLKIEGD